MKKHLTFALLTSALLSACGPNVETRGHVLDATWQTDIKPNVTTRDDMMAEFGSPSTISSFGDETWYYISLQRKNRAFLAPTIIGQDVAAVTFNADGTVKAVEHYNEQDMKNFALSGRTTPTEGHQLTVLEQTLGNLGRFNSPSKTGNPGSVRRGGR